MNATRWGGWISGLWGGVLLGVGVIGAPSAFAGAAPDVAGRIAARMFAFEAYLSLALAVLLYVLARRRARHLAMSGAGSVLSTDVLLVLASLFCTVAGYFALQPMLVAARAGQGSLSFGMLHGVSAGFYGIKTLLVLTLAWRWADA